MFSLCAINNQHTADVKAICVLSPTSFASASRDKTIAIHHLNSTAEPHILVGHTNYISSLATTRNHLLSGSTDKSIRIWSLSEYKQLSTSSLHSNNVVAIDCKDNQVLSASWDCHVFEYELYGAELKKKAEYAHPLAVWDAKIFKNGFISACADKIVRIYSGGVVERELKYHSDVVRSLSICGDTLYSSSNDTRVVACDLVTMQHRTVTTHLSFVYSVDSLDGLVVSGGEDRVLRISAGESKQILPLPCQSVWCVRLLSRDVLVVATNQDIRIFSTDPSKTIEDTTKAEFDTRELNQKIKVYDELPPNANEGEVKVVRKEAQLMAYQYSNNQWIELGLVQDSSTQVQEYTIDLDGRMMKIKYSSEMNPYSVAQKFIDDHELSQEYLDEIAKYLVKMGGGGGGGGGGQGAVMERESVKSELSPFIYFPQPLNVDGIKKKLSQFSIQFTTDTAQIFKLLETTPNDKIFPLLDILRYNAIGENVNVALLYKYISNSADGADINTTLVLKVLCNYVYYTKNKVQVPNTKNKVVADLLVNLALIDEDIERKAVELYKQVEDEEMRYRLMVAVFNQSVKLGRGGKLGAVECRSERVKEIIDKINRMSP